MTQKQMQMAKRIYSKYLDGYLCLPEIAFAAGEIGLAEWYKSGYDFPPTPLNRVSAKLVLEVIRERIVH